MQRVDPPECETEIAIVGKFYKKGVDSEMQELYVEDLASLDQISEESVMKELEARMRIGQFQTFIGDVLLVLNPNEKHDIFGNEV